MHEQHRLWAKFRIENNGEIQITLTPVVFWVSDEGGYHIACVLPTPSMQMTGYAIPFNESRVVNTIGQLDSFILHENIKQEIARLKTWAAADDDDRSLYVYPNIID